MNINSFDEIENIDDREIVTFPVPSWGDKTLYIRPLSSEQAEEITVRFSGINDDKEKMVGMRTALVKLSIVNSQGERLVKTDEQVKKLGAKSSAALKEIFEFCMELNGFSKKVEEAEKN